MIEVRREVVSSSPPPSCAARAATAQPARVSVVPHPRAWPLSAQSVDADGRPVIRRLTAMRATYVASRARALVHIDPLSASQKLLGDVECGAQRPAGSRSAGSASRPVRGGRLDRYQPAAHAAGPRRRVRVGGDLADSAGHEAEQLERIEAGAADDPERRVVASDTPPALEHATLDVGIRHTRRSTNPEVPRMRRISRSPPRPRR